MELLNGAEEEEDEGKMKEINGSSNSISKYFDRQKDLSSFSSSSISRRPGVFMCCVLWKCWTGKTGPNGQPHVINYEQKANWEISEENFLLRKEENELQDRDFFFLFPFSWARIILLLFCSHHPLPARRSSLDIALHTIQRWTTTITTIGGRRRSIYYYRYICLPFTRVSSHFRLISFGDFILIIIVIIIIIIFERGGAGAGQQEEETDHRFEHRSGEEGIDRRLLFSNENEIKMFLNGEEMRGQ